MTQYLVTTFKDSIGHAHPHVTAAKPNQTFTVIEAESKEEALEKAKKPKGLLQGIPSSFNNCRSISMPTPNRNHATPPRKDSE